MFSDKYYHIKVLSLMFLIFLACLYSQRKYQGLTLQECLSNPAHFDGTILMLGGNTKVGKVQKDRFELQNGEDNITVIGSVDRLKTNDYVDIVTIFHKEVYLELKEIYVRKLRRLKIVLSVLPVFLVTWLFLRQYRFDFTGRVLVER